MRMVQFAPFYKGANWALEGYITCSRLLVDDRNEIWPSWRSDIINCYAKLLPQYLSSYSSSQKSFSGFCSHQVAAKVLVFNRDIFTRKVSKDSWCVECSHWTIASFLGWKECGSDPISPNTTIAEWQTISSSNQKFELEIIIIS